MAGRIEEGKIYRYWDIHGTELRDGDIITTDGGVTTQELYRTVNGYLGTDATNPLWVKTGRAVPCQYGVYPLEWGDMETIEKVN